MFRDFHDGVCTGSTLLVRTIDSKHVDHFNTLSADGRIWGEYLLRYNIWVDEDGHSLHSEDDNIKEKHVGYTPSPGVDGKLFQNSFPQP